MSPTARTLAYLRGEGWHCEVTEQTIASKFKRDLWGFCDVVGIRRGETVCVQCTSMSNISSRIKKITEHENLPKVREAGWSVWVIGWAKEKMRLEDLS